MGMRAIVQEFVRQVTAATNANDLFAALHATSAEMGFEYFALSHHVDMTRAGSHAIRLHNYPTKWADYYDSNALGLSDPVHRASHVTNIGFVWSNMQAMIPLTVDDRRVLALGREQGVGDGFTVPANVPGESHGSCSLIYRRRASPIGSAIACYGRDAAKAIGRSAGSSGSARKLSIATSKMRASDTVFPKGPWSSSAHCSTERLVFPMSFNIDIPSFGHGAPPLT
jgi:hypothetical protein